MGATGTVGLVGVREEDKGLPKQIMANAIAPGLATVKQLGRRSGGQAMRDSSFILMS
jgi:hypothetical protein